MTAHFQFFMILGAAILLLMSNYDEKTGLRLSPEGGERKIQPSLAGTGRGSCHLCGIPLCCLRPA